MESILKVSERECAIASFPHYFPVHDPRPSVCENVTCMSSCRVCLTVGNRDTRGATKAGESSEANRRRAGL